MTYEGQDDAHEGTLARGDETTDQVQWTPPPRVADARVFLVRHADSGGPKDPELGMHLSDLGLRQARALATRLAHWQLDAILCSDMYRARETAAAVHSLHRHVPLIVDPTFREVSAGTVAAFERGDPAKAGLDVRLESAWRTILTLPYRAAVLVAHNGLIKVLLGRAIGCNALKPHLHSALTGITGIRVKPKGNVRVQFFNDTHHLTPELSAEEIAKRKVWIEDSATGSWTFGADKHGAEAVESA